MLRRLLSAQKAWVAAVLAPAADPRQAFAAPAHRQLELLDKLRHSILVVSESRARLMKRAADAESRVLELESRARQAVGAGRLDLARLALQNRQAAVADLVEMRHQVEELESEERRLQLVEQKVGAAVDAYRAKQELARARYDAAAAQVRIGEALTGVTGELGDLGIGLEAVEADARRMEARAAAIDRLISTGALDSGAPQLEIGSGGEVEAQLLALQAERDSS